jgi:hypothetical protein
MTIMSDKQAVPLALRLLLPANLSGATFHAMVLAQPGTQRVCAVKLAVPDAPGKAHAVLQCK